MYTEAHPETSHHEEEAKRLKRIFDERATMSQSAFGHEFEIGTQGMVSQYLLGRRPLNLQAAMKFARGLGVSIEDFSPRLAGEASEAVAMARESVTTFDVEKSRADRKKRVKIDILDVTPSAGHGGTPVDYPMVDDYLEVNIDWAQKNLGKDLKSFRVLPISGDSMSPTINDGDLVFVDTSIKTFEREGIYVIIWNERLLIKRLRVNFETSKVDVISDNLNGYGSYSIDAASANNLHICGLVRHWWSLRKS